MLLVDGHVRVFTYKEGLLSPIAHDLRLTCERFEVKIDGQKVAARFWPESLRVDGAVREGRVDPSALDANQKKEIVSNVRDKILHTADHPEIVLNGRVEPRDDVHEVTGELLLVGHRAPVEFTVERRNDRVRGRVELVPSRWGIKPFRALLGAIRVQDRVTVTFDFASPADLAVPPAQGSQA